MAKKPQYDPNTHEFWRDLRTRQGFDLRILSTGKHGEEGRPRYSHDCRHVRAIKDFSKLIKDAQVREGDVLAWVPDPDEGVTYCYRFTASETTLETAKLYDDGKLPEDKDIWISLRFDQCWIIKPRAPKPDTVPAAQDDVAKTVDVTCSAQKPEAVAPNPEPAAKQVEQQQTLYTTSGIPARAPAGPTRHYQPRVKKSRWDKRSVVSRAFGERNLPKSDRV